MEELKRIVEEIQKAFAEFKKLNDEQISEIKKKGRPTARRPVGNRTLASPNSGQVGPRKDDDHRLDEIETKAGRPRWAPRANMAKKAHAEGFGKCSARASKPA